MSFFYVTQPRRTLPVYQPPSRWAWGHEYDPFDLFSEFIGHHPTSLLGYPGLTFGPTLYAHTHPAPQVNQQKPHEEQKWHKIVKLPPYFGPEDFMVKTEGNTLMISAKHETKDEEGGTDLCEITRKVEVPEQVDMDSVRTLWLKRGGIMVVGHIKSPDQPPKQVEQNKDQAPKAMETSQTAEKKEGGDKPELNREMSIDPENFVSEMRSFAQDVHEALFGQGLPVPERDPQNPIPMEEGKEGQEAQNQDKPEEVRLDVTGYKPEEVKVSVENNTVNIEARHMEEAEDHTAMYHFSRSFTLPQGTIPTKVSHKLDPEKNLLVITMPSEKEAIEFKKEA